MFVYGVGCLFICACNDELLKLITQGRKNDLSLLWPAPGSEDTELGVLMELEVRHGEASVYAGVQA